MSEPTVYYAVIENGERDDILYSPYEAVPRWVWPIAIYKSRSLAEKAAAALSEHIKWEIREVSIYANETVRKGEWL